MTYSRVVIAPNWIGDSVMAIPLMRALRRAHPGDRLTILARRGPAAVFRAEGSADLILTGSGLLMDALALRRARFDEAWSLPNSFRAALIPFLGGVRERIGYATDRRSALLTHTLPAPPPTHHQLRDYDALLSSRGIEPDLEAPRLVLQPAAARSAAKALAAAGISFERPLILLSPGAAFGGTKRWPPERFGQLADRLSEKGFACAVVIGPAERDLAARVTAASHGRLPTLGADLDPAELAATLARAQLLVSNDSGPMHLAAAVGTPVVAFFGPTDPGRTAAVGSASRILDRYVFCSPCYLKTCPYGHECMKEITVESALRAVEEVLSFQ
jgi:heptosyltransferase II